MIGGRTERYVPINDYSLWPRLTEAEEAVITDIASRHSSVEDWNSGMKALLWNDSVPVPSELLGLFADPTVFEPEQGHGHSPTILSKRRVIRTTTGQVRGEFNTLRRIYERLFRHYCHNASGVVDERHIGSLVARRNALVNEFERVTASLTAGVFETLRSVLLVWLVEGLKHAGDDVHPETVEEIQPGYLVTLTASNVWDQAVRGKRLYELNGKNRWMTLFDKRGVHALSRLQGSLIEHLLQQRDAQLDDVQTLVPELAVCDRFVWSALRGLPLPPPSSVTPEEIVVMPRGIYDHYSDELVRATMHYWKTGMGSEEGINAALVDFADQHDIEAPSVRTVQRYLKNASVSYKAYRGQLDAESQA